MPERLSPTADEETPIALVATLGEEGSRTPALPRPDSRQGSDDGHRSEPIPVRGPFTCSSLPNHDASERCTGVQQLPSSISAQTSQFSFGPPRCQFASVLEGNAYFDV